MIDKNPKEREPKQFNTITTKIKELELEKIILTIPNLYILKKPISKKQQVMTPLSNNLLIGKINFFNLDKKQK